MPDTLAEPHSRINDLAGELEALLRESTSQDERDALDRIAKKLDAARSKLSDEGTSEAHATTEDAVDPDAQRRKAGRIGKLSEMSTTIAGLMSSLKIAR
jgi:hypothetical protein